MFVALLMLIPSLAMLAMAWCFSPMALIAAWPQGGPAMIASPLVSQLAQVGFFGAAFDAIFLLITGRYVEQSLGGTGVVVTFIAGAYGGALARLLLTPGSGVPGLAGSGSLFALIGAYLMLYGIPRGLPLNLRGTRAVQIAALALIWAAVQLVFMLVAAGGDLSLSIIEPLGGLAAGAAMARPLLAWRYRGA